MFVPAPRQFSLSEETKASIKAEVAAEASTGLRGVQESLLRAARKAREQISKEWKDFNPGPPVLAKKRCFDVHTDGWVEEQVMVQLDSEAFGKGAVRECFRMKEVRLETRQFAHMEGTEPKDDSNQAASPHLSFEAIVCGLMELPRSSRRTIWVAKRSIADHHRKIMHRRECETDVIHQTFAKHYAELFNQEVHRHAVETGLGRCGAHDIDFLLTHVVEMPDRVTMSAEAFVLGEYRKHNTNGGCTIGPRTTPQAFSYFTFIKSGRRLMIVDIQGVLDLYTDPVIHFLPSQVSGKLAGADMELNFGIRGFALFLWSHRRNDIDQLLNLPIFALSRHEERHLAPSSSRTVSQLIATTKKNAMVPPCESDAPGFSVELTEIPNVDLSDWCNWRGAVRHHNSDPLPEDLVEAECHMEIAAMYNEGRITLRPDEPRGPPGPKEVESAVFHLVEAARQDLPEAAWQADGQGRRASPLLGEPRLAMLLAERGSPWAEMCSDACVQMAAVAEAELQTAELELEQLMAQAAEKAAAEKAKEEQEEEAATTGAESKEAEEQSQGCANASASLDGGTEEASHFSGTADGGDEIEKDKEETEEKKEKEEEKSDRGEKAEKKEEKERDEENGEKETKEKEEERDQKEKEEKDEEHGEQKEEQQKEKEKEKEEEKEREKKEKERKLKEKEERAKKAEAEEARKRRAEERQLAKAKLGVVDAKSRIVEAKAAAEACKRMARPWPSGDWKSLLEHFKKELLVPILEAQGNDAGGLELNGRYGSWLGALLRAGCRPTERQVETLARQVSLALAEAAGPLLKDAMTFVEQLLEPLSVEASSTLVTALKRHGVEARLQRLAEVGAVGVVSSDSHMTLRPLRECAQRITQLPNWKAAESAENPVVADLVGRLLEPGVLDDVAELLRSEACTPYELALHAFPSRLLPLLSSSSEWPWPPLSSFSGETLEALVPALQWLLGLCETFPVAAAEGPVSGVDCLVRPLELTLESFSAETSKTLFVEPLLPLRDLERFLLQTSTPEEDYLTWCRSLVGQRLAEREAVSSSRGSKEAWRTAEAKSFDVVAGLPVHTLVYEDGEEAKLLLHLREVLVLGDKETTQEADCEGDAEALHSREQESEDVLQESDGHEANGAGREGAEEGQETEAAEDEKIYKLVVKMPMVQEGEIPFEMVWADLLEAGEAVLQASPDGTWSALGWKDRSELQEAFKTSLEANGQGTLARGMTREQANSLLERMDELADAMSVVADRNDVPDVPRPPSPKKSEGPICRRVQLQVSSRSVGVAVWEYADSHLDVVDQSGRFLHVPPSQIEPPSWRARHAPGRSLPLELSVLGLSGNSNTSSGDSGSFEWQFAGDQGWCRYDAAASRLLEAARERGEDTVSVRSGSNRYLVDIRAGTQTNMTHPNHRIRRVRRLGATRNGALLALERNFSGIDRGPVNDFTQKVLERKLGEEHFRQEEDVPSHDTELAKGTCAQSAPRLRVDFFAGDAQETPLPLECTVLQALLWEDSHTPAVSRSKDQRLRYALRTDSAERCVNQENGAPTTLRRDHTGVQAAGRAGAEGESATLLALLRRLRRFTKGDLGWENDQLNRKLAHQLAQPLLTAGGVVPSWVKALPLTYPFLFERRLKEQLLHCTGFGTSHAVLWLQRRCVEARFGEQLRLARERLARTGNDAELWEIHEQAAADETVFVGAGRSEMARLPGRGSCNLLEIAERVIQLTHNSRALLEVVFDDETGFGDGVTQSFYTDVAAEMCLDTEEMADLWAEHLPNSRVQHQGKTFLHSRRGLFPQPHVPGSPKSAVACKRFRFLGRLMAKALRDGFIVPVPLCTQFFEAVLGADLPLDALPSPGDGWAGEFLGAAARFAEHRRSGCATLNAEQPGWAAKYLQAKGAAGEMTFHEYSQHCFFLETGSSGIEICEGGAERSLNAENLDEFVECAAQWWLRDGIMPQVEAFRRGVEDVCDSPAIWAFEAEELQELMCGASAPQWTEKDLKQHLKFRGYNADSSAVQLLIQELVRMAPDRKAQFLEFVTACPRLPHGGLAAAEIAVVAAQPKGSLPRAHTCTNELQLPSYNSLEELSAKLLEAIENARGMYE